ncbi:MAG: methionine synthase [Chloroflexota bacterium]|nr:MAG: methionine synthase [Chloroflexota bacterium]
MSFRILETLRQRVLIYDGAMGTAIQQYNLTSDDFGGKEGCNDFVSITRPDVIAEIHASFCAVGVDVLETNTFGSSRLKLDEYGLGERHDEINIAAAQLARKVADGYATADHPIFVAGSLGPTGFLPSSDDPVLGRIGFDELADIYGAQSEALIRGGVDVLLIETSQDILEVKAAIAGMCRMFRRTGLRVPIQAQVTLDTTGRMLLGTDIAAVMTTLEALSIDVIGLNCSTGPEHMREPARFLCERSRLPVAVIPNAGLPINTPSGALYPLEPVPMAKAMLELVADFGVSIVGGCCGTTPEHLRAIVAAVGGRAPLARTVVSIPSVSSGMRAVSIRQEPAPMIVGERVNSVGSRAVKRLLLNDDYEGALKIARDQVDGGAHTLDVCVAMTERIDESEQMRRLVKKLAMGVEAPLMIDSTEWQVVEIALKNYPGRAMINSINLENRAEKVDTVLPIAAEHGACVVCMTIDERGMARTADHKFEIARRIHDIAVNEYGLPADALIFDVQTFPLVTGQEELADSGIETLSGIRQIKEGLPGVSTVLGISNVSFGIGLAGRSVLNSVFLYHAVRHGLDLAIVNPAHVTPYADIPLIERELAEDLIYNRRGDALARYIQHFESKEPTERDGHAAADPYAGLSAEERIHYQILHRQRDGIEAQIDDALTRRSAVMVLNEILLPAMKDVGDRFGAGELILPFVLQSAEVMKRAVSHVEQFLDRREGYTKGKIVVATVFGDVHDIGKNLVCTILGNNGYTVFDLGKQVPLNTIIEKATEVGADAIGLSALLVSTSKQMPLCVKELHRNGHRMPVLIGGAAINRSFGYRALFVDDDTEYEPGVFYCRDAFEGLETLDRLSDPERADAFVSEIREKARVELGRNRPSRVASEAAVAEVVRSSVRRDAPIPAPPFWGWRVLGGDPLSRARHGPTADTARESIDLDEVFANLDLKTLFRLHWGAKSRDGAEWDNLVEREYTPILARLSENARRGKSIHPAAVYGYFPCQALGNELLVYDADDRGAIARLRAGDRPETARVVERFRFPRQPSWDRLCLSDYFAEAGSGRVDVLPIQIVTVGSVADDLAEEMSRRGDYSEGYYLHGFATQCAEAMAELIHARVRRELGLAADQGRRYSWGYPACPDLEQHEIVFRLLPATSIDIGLTEGWQLTPEQSTAAMVVHHPEAKYYSTLLSGEAERTSVAAGR